ncbi:MAG: DNA repair protein RecN [Bdellovibrionota bacterium]
MLSVLRIHNLALVEELEVEFRSGLNVLTGETGAGKSIILKAIELLTGKRASAELIRTGADHCVVEGLFLRSQPAPASEDESDDLNELLQEEEILIRRAIDNSGKSKISVNGRLSTSGMLQNLAPYLLDITGQHQQQTLLDPNRHRSMLDEYGGHQKLCDEVSSAFHTWQDAKRQLEAFLSDQGQRAEYFQRITAEREELKAADLRDGRRAELEAELKRYASVETLTADVNRALELLEDSEGGIDAKLSSLSSVLDHILTYDSTTAEIAAMVESAAVQLSEAKIALSDYGMRLEADPERLEVLRETIAEIARLERKYGKIEAELVRYLESLEREIGQYESGELDETKLRARATEAEAVLKKCEIALSKKRASAGKKLSAQIIESLQPLGMKHAQFEVSLVKAGSSAHGAEKVEFLLAANPGEPLRSLSKVASGGELSRILLVVKTVLNEKSGPGTQIFDEIDSGISGAVAQIVGEKLHQIAARSQVILVTHSPQIAAFADNHFQISKSVSGERTMTSLRSLSDDERVQHIAGMLAGKRVSANFEQSARELMNLRAR